MMVNKKTVYKILTSWLCCLLLTPVFMAINAPAAQAKTTWMAEQDYLDVYVRNTDGQDVLVKIYSLNDLENMFSVDQTVYYSQIDAMPAPILGAAEGPTIGEFLAKMQADLQNTYPGINFNFDPATTQAVIGAADGPTRTLTADSTAQYFYPQLYQNWSSSSYPQITSVDNVLNGNPVPVQPILALRSYQERVGDGADYIPGPITSEADLEADEAIVVAHMDSQDSLRYMFGQTPDDIQTCASTESNSLKWINSVDIIPATPIDFPIQGTVDAPTVTAVPGPDPTAVTISFADDTPGAQIYYGVDYLDRQSGGANHLYDGTPVVVYPATNANGNIDMDPSYDIPTNDQDLRINADAEKPGWNDASTGSGVYYAYPYHGPDWSPDVTDNLTGQPIEITFADDPAWRQAITKIEIYNTADSSDITVVDPSHYSIAPGEITFDSTVFPDNGRYGVSVYADGGEYAYAPDLDWQDILAPAPALTAADPDATLGQDVIISFSDDAAWRQAISSISVDGAALDSSQYTVAPGSITIDKSVFSQAKDYAIVIKASYYLDATVIQTVGNQLASPALTSAPVTLGSGQNAVLSFSDDAGWRQGISSISVNGAALDSSQYTVAPGSITISSNAFSEDGNYTIVIKAVHYTDDTVSQVIEASLFDLGDINGDGVVNNLDVVKAVNFALGITTPTDDQLERADMNGDGVVNNLDVVKIVNKALQS
jgi:hypothetical protein